MVSEYDTQQLLLLLLTAAVVVVGLLLVLVYYFEVYAKYDMCVPFLAVEGCNVFPLNSRSKRRATTRRRFGGFRREEILSKPRKQIWLRLLRPLTALLRKKLRKKMPEPKALKKEQSEMFYCDKTNSEVSRDSFVFGIYY